MKRERGVTLVSLVLYMVVMSIVLAVMSSIISNFYKNTTTVQGSIGEIIEFNRFNTYFLKEVKSLDNSVDSINIEDNYILFSSGNSFSFSTTERTIYYNNIKICNNVTGMEVSSGKNGDGIDETIVYVKLTFEKFSKAINYKIENIY